MGAGAEVQCELKQIDGGGENRKAERRLLLALLNGKQLTH